MRKLLNTLYITNENVYISMEGETVVCKEDGKKVLQVPFDNIENITCFNYLGCSPALMGKCVEKSIPVNFVSPTGKFLAKVCGETKGNVFLRVQQIDCFRDKGLLLAQNSIAAKLYNSRQNIRRTIHDNQELKENIHFVNALESISSGIEKIYETKSYDELLGIEGNCAKQYFACFNTMITNKKASFVFLERTKRPPLDPVNAVLSFLYTLMTSDYAAALETVGLDSYIGYFHTLRSGRVSLACDMVEEARCIVERLTLTMINLRMLSAKDFDYNVSGAVYLNDEGRKKVLQKWQEKKKSDLMHPYLKQKIQYGLLPYVQSNLLAKYIRGEIDEYPSFLLPL